MTQRRSDHLTGVSQRAVRRPSEQAASLMTTAESWPMFGIQICGRDFGYFPALRLEINRTSF